MGNDTYIKVKTTIEEVGPRGYRAHKSKQYTCGKCGHDEIEVFRGGGYTEIYCCKCGAFVTGG